MERTAFTTMTMATYQGEIRHIQVKDDLRLY